MSCGRKAPSVSRVTALCACGLLLACADSDRGLVGVNDAGRIARYDTWATLNPQRCVDRNGGVIAGCPCLAGEEVECYTGPSAARRVGVCRDGVMRCQRVSAQELGVFDGTTCYGQVLPAATDTCGNNLDDNCNGRVDENCPRMDAGTPDVPVTDVPSDIRADGSWPEACVPRTCGPLCGNPSDGCGRTLTCRPCVSTCAATPAVLAQGPALVEPDLIVPWRGFVHMYVRPTRPNDERVLGRVPTLSGFDPVGLFPQIERPVFEGDAVIYEPGEGRIGMRRTDGTGPIYEFPTAVFEGITATGPRGVQVDGSWVYTVGVYDSAMTLGVFRFGRTDGTVRRLATLPQGDWVLFAGDSTHLYVRANFPSRTGDNRPHLAVWRVARAGANPETVFEAPAPDLGGTIRGDLFGLDATHVYGFRTDDRGDTEPTNDTFTLFRMARTNGAVADVARETGATVSPLWPPRLAGVRVVYTTGHAPPAQSSGVWTVPITGGSPARLLAASPGELFRAFGVENNCVYVGSLTADPTPLTRIHAIALP